MKTIKIFLASSAELENDRKEFETFLFRKSQIWKDERDIFIELKIWENFIDAMSKTRLQEEYNKAIRDCDIFVMLFWTKVGMYTEEEFEVARQQFLETGKPLIYTYFKDTSTAKAKAGSLETFEKKLKGLQHFKTVYKNIEGLLLHFSLQLDKLYQLKVPVEEQQATMEKISRERLYEMLEKPEVQEVFDELIKIFHGKNMRLNLLMDEYMNQSNNFNLAQFIPRLKTFINRYVN